MTIQLIGHYINGKSYAGSSSAIQAVFNPATGAQTGVVDLARTEDVDVAVAAAQKAFPAWADMHAHGEEGVRFYTKQKSIMQRWPENISKGAEFTMPVAR